MVPGSSSKPATCSWRQRMEDSDCALCSATATRSPVAGSTTCSAPRAPRCRHAGPGPERQRLRGALDPYRPRRVPRLAADHQQWSPGAGPPDLCRALQPTPTTPSTWARTTWPIRRSDPGRGGSASPGVPTRPPWWPASRIPASCMNAFTHPTGPRRVGARAHRAISGAVAGSPCRRGSRRSIAIGHRRPGRTGPRRPARWR
jgi:hypothetical protein